MPGRPEACIEQSVLEAVRESQAPVSGHVTNDQDDYAKKSILVVKHTHEEHVIKTANG